MFDKIREILHRKRIRSFIEVFDKAGTFRAMDVYNFTIINQSSNPAKITINGKTLILPVLPVNLQLASSISFTGEPYIKRNDVIEIAPVTVGQTILITIIYSKVVPK